MKVNTVYNKEPIIYLVMKANRVLSALGSNHFTWYATSCHFCKSYEEYQNVLLTPDLVDFLTGECSILSETTVGTTVSSSSAIRTVTQFLGNQIRTEKVNTRRGIRTFSNSFSRIVSLYKNIIQIRSYMGTSGLI